MKNIVKIISNLKSKILLILIIVSVLMTSSTFAYWSEYVEGNSTTTSSFISIGMYNMSTPLFTLSSEYATGEYNVIIEDIFSNTPDYTHTFNESFNAEWINEDGSWLDNYIINGDIEFEYEILLLKSNGNSVGSKKYDRLIPYVQFLFDEDNDSSITLNEAQKTFGFTLTITEPTRSAHYDQLEDLTVAVKISYTINNITYEYIYYK